jgi:hypothetical protein
MNESGFTACEKTPQVRWFVKGHEFTRAENAAKYASGFSPCMRTPEFEAAQRQELPEGPKDNSPGRGPQGQVFVLGVENGVRAKGADAILGKQGKINLKPRKGDANLYNRIALRERNLNSTSSHSDTLTPAIMASE